MAVVATPGAANANSFATEVEFTTYWASRPFNTIPSGLNDAQKTAALIAAGRLLNGLFAWTGTATDAVQAMTWPRIGMFSRNGYAIDPTVIPQELKDAQSELAGQMAIADITADVDADKQGISSVKAGSVSVSFQDNLGVSFDSKQAAAMMKNSRFFYMHRVVPDAVRILLVPSWYTEADLALVPEFDVVSPIP